MPDMPDSGVDESQVENNENIEKYRPSSIIKKSLSWLKVESWKLKVESWKLKVKKVCVNIKEQNM